MNTVNPCNILVTAHTGSGKSLVAEYAILKAIEQKRKDDESDQSKALKVIQANIVADVKQCFDMEILEAVHKVLNGYDFEVAG
jgi:uncharacterized protein (DUF302 family)